MAGFTPVPSRLKKKIRFNLNRIYFDKTAFEKDKQSALRLASRLAAKEGTLKTSAKNLLEVLRLYFRLFKLHMRLHTYAMLKFARNIKENVELGQIERIGAELSSAGAFIEPEILELGERRIRAFMKKEKGLARFSFWLENILRAGRHALSTEQEKLLSALSPHLTAWHHKLYNVVLEREDFGSVKTPEGSEFHVRRQATELAINANSRIRKKSFLMRIEGYRRYRDLHAFTLLRTIETQNALARIAKFKDATDRAAFNRWMTVEQFEAIFEKVKSNAKVYKEYERCRRKRVGRVQGLRKVHPWDLALQTPGFKHPRFTITQAIATVRKALAPLGRDYIKLYDELTNPANGRLDLVSGPNRSPGGFCTRIFGDASYIYAFGYEGFVGDLYLITHEAGHAIQMDLMEKARIPFTHAILDPGYVTEAFAMVNEMFLFDYLRLHASKDQKVYFEEKFVSKYFDIYSTVETASLEWGLYHAVDKGEVSNADDFDAFTRRHRRAFSIYAKDYDYTSTQWMTVMHFTAAPLYYPSYVIAKYLSMLFYQRLLEDKSFVKRYLALIRNGFDRHPVRLIRDFTGIDLDDPDILSPVFAAQRAELERLENIYAGS